MTWTGIEIENKQVTLLWFKKLSNLMPLLDRSMKRWSTALHRNKLFGRRNYVPEIPGQKYIRTGDLGEGHELTHPALAAARFVNIMDYAGRVLGDSEGKGQAWMHKNRWWVERKVIEDGVPGLIKIAVEDIEKAS